MAHGECPSPQTDCKYALLPEGCFSDEHHLYYPKRRYCGKMAIEFRELPENKEQLCRREHDERHATEPIPIKPSVEVMKAAIAASKAARS